MAVQLPPPFVQRMQQLLGTEFEDFIRSYEQSPRAGLRVNTLKISNEQFREISPFDLRPIPWCETGYYINADARPGKHPYYYTGLYYIQEPSAMSPVEALQVQPGDRVLDLCAAPGGKSTQIAAALQGQGLLVTNDLSAERTRALAKNMELYGVRNAVILNESPDRIAEKFNGFFDKILVDAPCSGEGMFRKDDDAARQWLNHSVEKCAIMQKDILQTVARMLAPGGRIVYSTCTFAPEENERSIAVFLDNHPHFQVTRPVGSDHFLSGRSDWAEMVEQELAAGQSVLNEMAAHAPVSQASLKQTADTVRLWPHHLEGEGHYIAVLDDMSDSSSIQSSPADGMERYEDRLQRHHEIDERPSVHDHDERSGKQKRDERKDSSSRRREYEQQSHAKPGRGKRAMQDSRHSPTTGSGKKGKIGRGNSISLPTDITDGVELWHQFRDSECSSSFRQPQGSHIITYGSNLYLSPLDESRLQGLKVIRPGWYLGSHKKGRFTPGHALAVALSPSEASRIVHLDSRLPEAISYLKGETLSIPEQRVQCSEGVSARGYVLVCIDGYSAGWGKWQQDGNLKNEYPAGWRWM
ncbi:RsmB/NOP family class I SAM-dependent RNA methyltransferase [Paenibacillus sp. WLX1005]|uniref:RsmB/NOP family class I SAM-dependent RNA methyltransferase n=1 Tax=Paenibacillus sp. WLX1005 TaxID=3243766 RepID=UPI003983F396